eukprot:SAG31_NODE_18233_length_642_cov_1.499079_1_plen_20_part_01
MRAGIAREAEDNYERQHSVA